MGLIRHEEELTVGTTEGVAGKIRFHKEVDHERLKEVVPRKVERAEMEHQPPVEGDSGEVEVLADGSISIPVFEEELVIEKRLVLRERIILRKHMVTEEQLVEVDLRRERVQVEADAEVIDRVKSPLRSEDHE